MGLWYLMSSNKTPIKMLKNHLLVKQEEGKEQAGLIELPHPEPPRPMGKVLLVGPEAEMVKEGDTVVFSRRRWQLIKLAGEDYHIMPEEDVLAVLEEQ